MIFRPFHYFDTGCAAYVFGCGTLGLCTVVDPQERDVDAYIAFEPIEGPARAKNPGLVVSMERQFADVI